MTHFPLPWTATNTYGEGFTYRMVQSALPPRNPQLPGDIGIVTPGHNSEADRGNVEFVLRAVNNHYQLLDALKKMVKQFQDEADPSYAGDVETVELALKAIQEAEASK